MNVIWRFLWTILFSRFDKPLGLLDKGSTTYRVLPTDIDVLLHMNNGRYFSLMDLARINFMIRSKFFAPLKAKKIYPVIASEMMRFKKSLNLWKKFSLTSQIIGWDDKFFYVLQSFVYKDDVHAMGLIKARFIQPGKGPLSPQNVLDVVGAKDLSPVMPDWVMAWQEADRAMYNQVMETSGTQ